MQCVQFQNAALHPVMLDNIRKCGYTYPTTIQQYTIPAVLTGSDVVAVSQTGKATVCLLDAICSR